MERIPEILSEKTVDLKWRIPLLTVSEETSVEQSAGGIKISIAPELFHKETHNIKKSHSRGHKKSNTGKDRYRYVDDESIPTAYVTPGRLSFRVTVHNQMKRILRLEGSVISVNVEGKQIALTADDYKEFLGGIVLSRGEQQYTIRGPDINSLPEKETVVIGLFIHDVVVETDAAGNPTKRENFHWYYTCQFKEEKEQQKTKVERKVVDTLSGACLNCDGDIIVPCSRCGGSGIFQGILRVAPCHACEQRGKFLCGSCKGTGRK